MPGLDEGRELAAGDPVGRLKRQAVVEHRGLAGVEACAITNGAQRQPRRPRGRCAGVSGSAGQPFADPGPAARLAEHGPPVQRVLGPGRPVQVDEQVGDGGRRQQRLVPPGGQVHPAPGPVQPPGEVGVDRPHVDVGEVAGALPGPGRPGQVGRLGVDVHRPGRLVVPQPQPGGRAEERARHRVLGEPVQALARRRRPRRKPRRGRPRTARTRRSRCRSPASSQRLARLEPAGAGRLARSSAQQRLRVLGRGTLLRPPSRPRARRPRSALRGPRPATPRRPAVPAVPADRDRRSAGGNGTRRWWSACSPPSAGSPRRSRPRSPRSRRAWAAASARSTVSCGEITPGAVMPPPPRC